MTMIEIPTQFTILIDSMEQHPFSFYDIRPDKSKLPANLYDSDEDIFYDVQTEFKGLGASHGDYSVKGMNGVANIERKSMEDAQSTILGWGARRERFERELEWLSSIKYSAVVVECSLGTMLQNAAQWGKKTAAQNKKALHRQYLSWQQNFKVPWIFCDTRALAEHTTFRILERAWRKEP